MSNWHHSFKAYAVITTIVAVYSAGENSHTAGDRENALAWVADTLSYEWLPQLCRSQAPEVARSPTLRSGSTNLCAASGIPPKATVGLFSRGATRTHRVCSGRADPR